MVAIRQTQTSYMVIKYGRKVYAGSYEACVAYCRRNGWEYKCVTLPPRW